MADDEQMTSQRAFADALGAPIPRVYTNGIALAQSLSDISLVLHLNGQPVAMVYASFNTIKTLAEQMIDLIQNIEKDTGQPILTMSDIKERMADRPPVHL